MRAWQRTIGIMVMMLCVTSTSDSLAQWTTDGVPIRVDTLGSWVYQPEMTTDGEGGAIITWPDPIKRQANFDIYAQRVDSSGVVRWQVNGIAVCEAQGSGGSSGNQYCVKIVSDGRGGAIIAWEDFRTPSRDIWAQRVDGDGNAYWQKDGVPICTAGGQQEYLELLSDGTGGAIIVFEDSRHHQTTGIDIYAQRVDSTGWLLWDSAGMVICEAPGNQWLPQLTTDGEGGAIIVWHDGEAHDGGDIYAQRVDNAGDLIWEKNGRPICVDEGKQGRPRIISDGEGGAIITWLSTGGELKGICAQRINGGGELLWDKKGVIVFLESVDSRHALVSDGKGGAIVVANRRGFPQFICAQRLNPEGLLNWGEGIPVSGPGGGRWRRATSDHKGGAIVTWDTYSSGPPYLFTNIYAQRVDSNGVVAWEPDSAVLVCKAAFDQELTRVVGDGEGGAVITWCDWRNSIYDDSIYACDIYAQRVYHDGKPEIEPEIWGDRLPLQFGLVQNYPNPFNPKTVIIYQLSTVKPTQTSLRIYNLLGKEVKTLVDESQRAGRYKVVWDGRNNRGREVSSGIYFCTLSVRSHSTTQKLVLLR